MSIVLLVGIVVALAVLLLLYGLGRAMQPAAEIDQRVEAWIREIEQGEGADGGFDASQTLLGQVERGITRRGFGERTATELARADLSLTVTEYLLIRVGIVLAAFVVVYLLQRDLLAGLLAGLVGYIVPIIYIRTRQSRRLAKFNNQLPDVLDHMIGSLRAGYGLLQSVEWIAQQMPDPAGYEFRRVAREVQLGRSLQDALDSMVRRIASDDLALIITAIKIQYQVGGSLADILTIVAHTIRERVRIQREISVLTAQQRFSAYVLMVMPIGLAIFLLIINPEYEKQLFTPGPTLCIPIGAAIMMIAGFLIIRRIVDIEV